MKIYFFCLTLILSLNIFSLPLGEETSSLCTSEKELGKMPIQQNGRIKPLVVHSQEILRYLTGRRPSRPVSTYCRLSLSWWHPLSQGEVNLMAKVDHPEIASLLSFSKGQKSISYKQLLSREDFLRRQISRFQEESSAQKSLKKLLSQTAIYREIISAQNWQVPTISLEKVQWVSLRHFLTPEKLKNTLALSPSQDFMAKLLKGPTQTYEKHKGELHHLEYHFAQANLPTWALIFTLLSLGALTVFRRFSICLSLALFTVAIQMTLITLRVIISGRAPITNMYETVLFSGFAALLLALLIARLKREKVFVYLGLTYNLCTLIMINFATGMLNGSLSPLVPVLRDNFWLSTHVTTIIVSYGALALSWVLANTILIRKRFRPLSPKDEAHYAQLTYTCLKYGTITLGAGIILGGIWADYSWGRFWGWDPKETWSLIAFCLYMAILHGRYTQWISPHRFLVCTAAAFLSIMMAWFGVNYILAAGLHSYGFSEGGAIFLGTFFILQIGLLLATTQFKKAGAP